MSNTNIAKKAVYPLVAGFDPYALGEEYLKVCQRSFDGALDNVAKITAFSQNFVDEAYAQLKEWQENGVETLEEITEGVRKAQNEFYKEIEAGFDEMRQTV